MKFVVLCLVLLVLVQSSQAAPSVNAGPHGANRGSGSRGGSSNSGGSNRGGQSGGATGHSGGNYGNGRLA
ncbi:hypothetical protein JTB14_003423 [Gonioctena quinquepunctata]|nr:hypothetical protein JTB14_003423 [Gonioctena quinquepunctata]